jgi:hypothetical protein
LQAYLESLPTPDGADVDPKVLADALVTMQKVKNQYAAHTSRMTWRTIMTSRMSKLAVAGIVIAAVLSFSVFDSFTKPAWALEDAIKAMKDLPAIHVVDAFPGGTAEIWIRANQAMTRSTNVVIKGSHGAITWTRDGSTYHYEPGQNTVYFENALTVGLSQWLGPGLLEMLSTSENAELVRGKDPATGRDRVTLLCSLIDVHGPQSWIIEFDVASKLPVAFKHWANFDRNGPPAFDAFKITYYENLPDSMFDVRIPGDPTFVEKPLAIPDENIGLMSDLRYGLSAERMSQQEAAEQIVRDMYQAVIDADMERFKRLCPVCEGWGDEFLRTIIVKPNRADRIVEVVRVDPICKTGQTKLGPMVAVPTVVRLANGKRVEEKTIVQFRNLGGKSSCVVHGPYGLPREIE